MDILYCELTGTQINQNQFDALVSFAFNEGCRPLALIAETLNTGNFAAATARMKLYNKAAGQTSAGLVRRRKEEVDLFNS